MKSITLPSETKAAADLKRVFAWGIRKIKALQRRFQHLTRAHWSRIALALLDAYLCFVWASKRRIYGVGQGHGPVWGWRYHVCTTADATVALLLLHA
jgi:hypothetical protein